MSDTKKSCLICSRIRQIRRQANPYFVKELKTGYVVIGDYQFFKGYSLFLCKIHKAELHQLPKRFRAQYFLEMSLVAKAVHQAFRPAKLNYELLGNTDRHLHWHIFPRYKNDPLPRSAVWRIQKSVRESPAAKPKDKTLEQLKIQLLTNLNRLIKNGLLE